MSTEKAVSQVAAIELEAEKILREARSGANEILLKADEEAKKILSSNPALEETGTECEIVVQKARKEAEQRVNEAKVKASQMRAEVGGKMKGIAARLVNEIAGV